MLVRLIYVSRAVKPPSSETTESIVAQSQHDNPAHGITGILCFSGGVYLQALEGGREAVNDLYGHIQRDARHKDIVLLNYEEISERRFAGWTMGQVNLSRINPTLLLKYFARSELDPYAVSGAVSLALLDELMATASVCGHP